MAETYYPREPLPGSLQLPEVPVAYIVPQSWGGIYVSKNGDELLGLTPQTTVIQAEGMPVSEALQHVTPIAEPRYDIMLVSPEEAAGMQIFHHPAFPVFEAAGVRGYQHQKGVGVVVGFTGNRQLLQGLMDTLLDVADDPDNAAAQLHYLLPEGVDIRVSGEEMAENGYRYFTPIIMANMILASLSSETVEWYGRRYDQYYQRVIDLTMAGTIGAAATTAAINALVRQSKLRTTSEMLIAITASLAIGHRQLRSYVSGRAVRERAALVRAQDKANVVSRDILHTFAPKGSVQNLGN